MGKVKIDILKNDFKYLNTSFSNVEDVYEVIERLDEIFFDAYNGNHEALVILIDLENLINDIESEEHKNFMLEYLLIQTGQKPMEAKDKNIFEVISQRLNLDKEYCQQLFLKSIDLIIENNYEKWLDFYYNNYFGKSVPVKEKVKKSNSLIDDESFLATDYMRKYVVSNFKYNKENLPEDLQQFIDYKQHNYNEIKYLQQELKKEKDKEKKKNIEQEIKKRIRVEVDLNRDISTLKDIYKIQKSKVKKTKTTILKYWDNYNYSKNENNYSVIDEVNINKINNVAKKILTDRQYIIFDLYYNVGLTQQKIAIILNDDQRNITNDLKYLIKKIKLEL